MTHPTVPHRFELTLEVPGTPEQVWEAIATAEGISAWMVPTELEERPGGALTFSMGPDDESHGRITGWDPPRRFAYEEDWAGLVGQPGAEVTPLATEFLVEARSGGSCVVRVVTSAFGTGAQWEHEFWEEMDRGWAPMLDNLRLYLTHFPGQQATPLWAGASVPGGTPEAAVAAVRRGLNVSAPGDAVRTRGIEATAERVLDRHLLLRVHRPVPGLLSFFSFGSDDGVALHVQGQLFSDGAAAYVAREAPAWSAWLDAVVTADVGAT